MLFYPNAKINIGLNIVGKRPNGYHNLETVFYPIPLSDILEIVPDNKEENSTCSFSQSGISFDGNPEDNICVKAYKLLDRNFKLPAVKIHLHKQIPVGAGLGGGSSDAAFTLKALTKMFNLDLDENSLEHYASKLGADCAFFVRNEPRFATGIGDEFESCTVDLQGKVLVLVCPEIHSSTQEAYSGITVKASKNLKETITTDIAEWKRYIINDFEESIFPIYPQIQNIKDHLYQCGAEYASMSGSGSAVFGIFNSLSKEQKIAIGGDCHIFEL